MNERQGTLEVRSILGAMLVQQRDRVIEAHNPWDVAHAGLGKDAGSGLRIVSKRHPTPEEWQARRFAVTGVDVSERQVQLARENVPEATLIRTSMTAVEFPPEAFDAVVAFHSIIHVPRAEQPLLVRRIHGWLRPGGAFLATWAMAGALWRFGKIEERWSVRPDGGEAASDLE